VERRIRRILDIKLDALCGGLAPQQFRDDKGAVDAGGDACRANDVAVDDDTFIGRDRAEVGQ
jgi:hypothetical protein